MDKLSDQATDKVPGQVTTITEKSSGCMPVMASVDPTPFGKGDQGKVTMNDGNGVR